MQNAFKAEPAVIVGALTAFVTAVIAGCVAFGMDISDEQRNAILGMIAPTVGVIMLMAGLIRQLVFAPDTAKEIAQEAADTGTVPDAVK